jgi:hypothetical protein
MKSKIASATDSSIAGKAISKSRPRLALPAGCEAESPVGIIESEAAPNIAAGMLNAESIIGNTFKFSLADSFCKPNRTPEYFPSSFKLGATSE